MNETADLHKDITALLHEAGDYRIVSSIEQSKRIGNNRTYLINVGGTKYFAKHFFQDKDDQRDRFHAEQSFISYAEKVSPGFTPRILSVNALQKLVLYEFIKGKPLQKGEITGKEVAQAALFFGKLNQRSFSDAAYHLPKASEACFSINDHISLIHHRIEQLESIPTEPDENRQALQTIQVIRNNWNKLTKSIHAQCLLHHLSTDEDLEEKYRILSPSDFGFHNALVKEDGNIVFLDFEYSGWDDPAKMIGDFFGQIQVPVPREYFAGFMNQALSGLLGEEQLTKRAEIMSPAFQIKWACIALNVFLPVHLARRKFASPQLDVKELKRGQLVKAEAILKNFQTYIDGIH